MTVTEYLKPKLNNLLEESIIIIVMVFVLLPVRVVFVTYVTPNWFGSFGLITIIIVSLVILSKKNKLGYFGRIFWKQTIKFNRGKLRYVSYFMIALNLFFWVSVVAGINHAATDEGVQLQKQNMLHGITPEEQKQIDELSDAAEKQDFTKVRDQLNNTLGKLSPEIFVYMIIGLFLLPIFDFQSWSVLVSFLDEFTNGYFLHFGTVFLVEVLELIGIIIYVNLSVRKEPA